VKARKIVSGMLLVLLIVGALSQGFLVVSVQASDTIVDTHGDSRFTKYGGSYWISVQDHDVFHTRAYNNNFWFTLCGEDGHGDPLYFGDWLESVPQSGVYEVFAWIPNPDAFVYDGRTYTPTQSAKYQIWHNNGMTERIVNQRMRTGGFYSLGTYEFTTVFSVILNDRTGEPYCSTMIAFDAIKFVAIAPPTPTVHLESRKNDGSTSNLGTITFDSVSYGLPVDLSKASGTYQATYYPVSGHEIDHWETSGGMSVPDPYVGQSTNVYVSGSGTLRAVYRDVPPSTYDATISAYCNTDGTSVNVGIVKDGSSTGFNTPHPFIGLSGSHTFTVPDSDGNGHPFKQWSTGQTTKTITVSYAGTYTAYYQAPPPPTYDAAVAAHCNREGVDVSVSITMDGSSSGFNTPHPFTGLIGSHTFAVPASDGSGDPFINWNTGQTSTTITVSSAGTYTAYYQATPPIPNPLTLVSPGSSSSPGEEICTLTPAFMWNSVPSADQFGLYIRDMDSNELVFDSQARGMTMTGTSYALSSGILQWGKHYRWNMNSHNEAGWGEFSPPLYFYTAQLDLLSRTIQQEMQEKVTVSVDGKEYYIVTIKRYIDPLSWEPSDCTHLADAPDARKVYTDTDFIPIVDKELAGRIGKIEIIDRANNLLKHIGSPGSISNQLGVINDVLWADKELADAEYSAVWARTAIFMTLDLCFYVEIEHPLEFAGVISDTIVDQLKYYVDPERFMLEGGRALLEAAKQHYEEAKRIAEENTEGFHDYDTARDYLNSFYNAQFKNAYGVDIVLSRERISKNTFWEITGWIPDYINHLGAKLVSLMGLWGKISTTSMKVLEVAKLIQENMVRLREFIENVGEMQGMVAQLLEDESFPVDYSQALAYQSISMLAQWGIIGVDEIDVNIACPAELSIYDSNRNATGIVRGEIMMEIPTAFYYNNTVTIFLPNDTYTIEVIGIGTGTYRLEALYVEDKGITSFVAIDLPTSSNVTHQYTIDWDALSLGEEGVTVQIDSDGEGVPEHTFTSDSELTQSEFLANTILLGDLNLDGIVNMLDAIEAASAFGSHAGDPRWDEQADINRDGVVNILDIITLANNFGKTA